MGVIQEKTAYFQDISLSLSALLCILGGSKPVYILWRPTLEAYNRKTIKYFEKDPAYGDVKEGGFIICPCTSTIVVVIITFLSY